MKKILLKTIAIMFALILVFCVAFSVLKQNHPLFYLREPLVKEVVCVFGSKSYVLDEEEKETVLVSLRELCRGEKAEWSDEVIPDGGASTCFAIRLLGGKTIFFELFSSGIFAIDRNLYHTSKEDREKDGFNSFETIAEKYYNQLIQERLSR